MEIKRLMCKFNGNPKTLYSVDELNSEYKSYNDLHSLQVTVITDNGEYELSLLSIFHLMTTGKLGEYDG